MEFVIVFIYIDNRNLKIILLNIGNNDIIKIIMH